MSARRGTIRRFVEAAERWDPLAFPLSTLLLGLLVLVPVLWLPMPSGVSTPPMEHVVKISVVGVPESSSPVRAEVAGFDAVQLFFNETEEGTRVFRVGFNRTDLDNVSRLGAVHVGTIPHVFRPAPGPCPTRYGNLTVGYHSIPDAPLDPNRTSGVVVVEGLHALEPTRLLPVDRFWHANATNMTALDCDSAGNLLFTDNHGYLPIAPRLFLVREPTPTGYVNGSTFVQQNQVTLDAVITDEHGQTGYLLAGYASGNWEGDDYGTIRLVMTDGTERFNYTQVIGSRREENQYNGCHAGWNAQAPRLVAVSCGGQYGEENAHFALLDLDGTVLCRTTREAFVSIARLPPQVHVQTIAEGVSRVRVYESLGNGTVREYDGTTRADETCAYRDFEQHVRHQRESPYGDYRLSVGSVAAVIPSALSPDPWIISLVDQEIVLNGSARNFLADHRVILVIQPPTSSQPVDLEPFTPGIQGGVGTVLPVKLPLAQGVLIMRGLDPPLLVLLLSVEGKAQAPTPRWVNVIHEYRLLFGLFASAMVLLALLDLAHRARRWRGRARDGGDRPPGEPPLRRRIPSARGILRAGARESGGGEGGDAVVAPARPITRFLRRVRGGGQ